QPLRPAHHTLRIAAPPGGIQPPPPTSPLTSLARRSRFVQPRGKQRARVKPRHIPNRSAGRAAYLAFLFGSFALDALIFSSLSLWLPLKVACFRRRVSFFIMYCERKKYGRTSRKANAAS